MSSRLLAWLRRLFGISSPQGSDQPWVRWSDAKQAQVLCYLNSLVESERTEDTAALAMEWMIHHYIQEGGVIRTEADYAAAMTNVRKRIRHNIAHPPPPMAPSVSPDLIRVPEKIMARGLHTYDLLGIPQENVREAFVRQYQSLAAAKANGSPSARGLSARREHCKIAHDLVDGREYDIDALLAAYQNPMGPIPIIPHPLCQMLDPGPGHDSSEPCLCLWTPRPGSAPGADPELVAWLDAEIEKIHTDTRAHAALQLSELRDRHAEAARQLTEAEHGILPWPALTDLDIVSMQSIHDLRQLQRAHGVRGHRTKLDIAQQLLALPAAQTTLSQIIANERANRDQRNEAAIQSLRGRVAMLEDAIAEANLHPTVE